jgi:hypothetical protein
MDPRQRYKNVYGSILTTLRSLDPLGHVAEFEGDRGEGHAYSGLAATIIEKLRQHRTPEAVEAFILEFARTEANINRRNLKEASGHVAKALTKL